MVAAFDARRDVVARQKRPLPPSTLRDSASPCVPCHIAVCAPLSHQLLRMSASRLLLFKTAWGSGDLDSMLRQAKEAHFDGIEAPAPLDPSERAAFFSALRASGLSWIAEVSTCTPVGKYVPTPRLSVAAHLASLREGVERSLEGAKHGMPPLFVNTMAGSDSWSAAEALEFHTGVVRLQEKLGVVVVRVRSSQAQLLLAAS